MIGLTQLLTISEACQQASIFVLAQVSKAQLKRDLEELGRDLYNIDLQIKRIRKAILPPLNKPN